MNVKLKNRKSAEARLHAFLENVAISDTLVVGIVEGDINAEYVNNLRDLERKINYCEMGDEPPLPPPRLGRQPRRPPRPAAARGGPGARRSQGQRAARAKPPRDRTSRRGSLERWV